MTGDDVKRLVMEALKYSRHVNAFSALAPCIVLTAEEAEEMLDHRKHLCAACIRRLQKAPPSSPFSTETVLR